MRVNSDCYADAAAKIGEPFQNICRGENQPDEIVRACEESISRARKFIGKIESLKTKALKADLSNA